MDLKKIEQGVKLILEGVGEDLKRPGLRRTPERVAKMFQEILSGTEEDPSEILSIIEEEEHEEMVLIRNIPLYSICEHHLLPFAGIAHIAYIPFQGKIIGLSKLVRLIDVLSKRLQVQERLTKQVADLIEKKLKPQGVMVVIEAEHLCLSMRGVKKPKSITVTSAVRGLFRKNASTRSEALSLMKLNESKM